MLVLEFILTLVIIVQLNFEILITIYFGYLIFNLKIVDDAKILISMISM